MPADCEEIDVASPTGLALGQLDANSTSNPGGKKRTTNDKKNVETNSKRTFWLREAVHLLLEQWFLVSLGLLIAIASQFQVAADQQKLKRTVTSYLCISIIFFKCVFALFRSLSC